MKTAFLSNKIQYICISLLLSAMHINTISDFIRSTCLIISWFIVIYHDISWYVLIFLDKSWYITMYHDLSWFITIYHDISWFPTVLGEVNDECHCHTDFCPINHLIKMAFSLHLLYHIKSLLYTFATPKYRAQNLSNTTTLY